MRDFLRYSAYNPFFALNFLVSAVPVWAVLFLYLTGMLDGISAALAAVLILLADSYVEGTVSVSGYGFALFDNFIQKPADAVILIVSFLILYFSAITFSSLEMYTEFALVLVLGVLLLILLFVNKRQRRGENVWGVSGVRLPEGSGLISGFVYTIFWLYILTGGDPVTKTAVVLTVIFMHSLRFVKRFEGVL